MNNLTNNPTSITSSADPWSQYSEWKVNALEVRRQWMEMMGLSDEEIEEYCAPGQFADLDEELEQYNAMVRIQKFDGVDD